MNRVANSSRRHASTYRWQSDRTPHPKLELIRMLRRLALIGIASEHLRAIDHNSTDDVRGWRSEWIHAC